MRDCCGTPKPANESASCCGGGVEKPALLYACSGSANVGEISDKSVRTLMFTGEGAMSCLAGLGGDVPGMVQAARDADVNVVIDGCPMGCAKKTLDRHGITNYRQVTVTDCGIKKAKGVRCTQTQVDTVVAKVREMLAT